MSVSPCDNMSPDHSNKKVHLQSGSIPSLLGKKKFVLNSSRGAKLDQASPFEQFVFVMHMYLDYPSPLTDFFTCINYCMCNPTLPTQCLNLEEQRRLVFSDKTLLLCSRYANYNFFPND